MMNYWIVRLCSSDEVHIGLLVCQSRPIYWKVHYSQLGNELRMFKILARSNKPRNNIDIIIVDCHRPMHGMALATFSLRGDRSAHVVINCSLWKSVIVDRQTWKRSLGLYISVMSWGLHYSLDISGFTRSEELKLATSEINSSLIYIQIPSVHVHYIVTTITETHGVIVSCGDICL